MSEDCQRLSPTPIAIACVEFRALLRRSLIALAMSVLVIIVCYNFVDRPVAFFVQNHRIARFDEFRWLTEPPPLVQGWSPLVIAALLFYRAWKPWRLWQYSLFVACLSLIVADQLRQSLGDACGRYWPETWQDSNPSLIGTGAYGFHPFETGDDTGSFPSGHAARILAFFTVLWLTLPRGRIAYALMALPMLVALVAMNYHFVSDVVAGSVLGGVVGAYAVQLSNLGAALSAPSGEGRVS
jgi:membrane-associated phospholipid phosphatase